MKTFKFYIGNDVNKEVIVNLTKRELKIYRTIYGYKSDQEIYDKMLLDMEDEFENFYPSFEKGKHAYENFIHEIVDANATGLATGLYWTGQVDAKFMERANKLLITHHLMVHRKDQDVAMNEAQAKIAKYLGTMHS